jgi:hypothetical protein
LVDTIIAEGNGRVNENRQKNGAKKDRRVIGGPRGSGNYLLASSIATATATVIPTMGLLPAPMSPFISIRILYLII